MAREYPDGLPIDWVDCEPLDDPRRPFESLERVVVLLFCGGGARLLYLVLAIRQLDVPAVSTASLSDDHHVVRCRTRPRGGSSRASGRTVRRSCGRPRVFWTVASPSSVQGRGIRRQI